jgi:hypothetical protein
MTAAELGSAVGAHERYVREWLSNQAASNYLTYDPTTRKFSLSGEQAMVFAVDDSPVTLELRRFRRPDRNARDQNRNA